jgi:hypothetical protein
MTHSRQRLISKRSLKTKEILKISGSKTAEGSEEWRILQIQELHDLYSSSRSVCVVESSNAYRILVGKPL